MKKISFILLSAALSLAGLTSCHKCKQKQFPSQEFSQQDLAIHPYTGQETLLFMNSEGDSIVLKGKKRETTQEFIYSNDPSGDDVMLYECFGNYYYGDANATYFNDPSNKAMFQIYLNFSNMFWTGTLAKQMAFVLVSSDPKVYYFNERFCFISDSILESPNYPNNKILAFYDSYALGNTTYRKVYKLGCRSGNYLFFTIKDGVIGFVTEDFILFTLHRRQD